MRKKKGRLKGVKAEATRDTEENSTSIISHRQRGKNKNPSSQARPLHIDFFILAILLIWMMPFALLQAAEIEGFAGANYTTFTEIDEQSMGVSARLKMNFYKGASLQSGFFLQSSFRAINVLLGDYLFGYGWRSGRTTFFELGVGARYHMVFGPGPAVLLGIGHSLNSSWYFSLPLIYRGGLIEWSPYVGYRF